MPNEVNVVSTDDAEAAEYVVCVRATDFSPYKDNVFSFCCECGEKVQHRPHVPTVPKKICLKCATPMMEEAAKNKSLEIDVTKETAAEVKRYFRGQ